MQIFQNLQLVQAGATSRANAAFADLFSQAITTNGGDIEVDFSSAYTVATTAVVTTLCFAKFQVLLDGAVVAGAGGGLQQDIVAATNQTVRGGTSIIKRITGVAAGAHTVKVQWATDAATTTVAVDPTLATSPDHATLWVREIIN